MPAAEATGKQPTVRDGWRQEERGFSLSALTFYSVLTVLVIAGALLATVYLGRQPRLQAGANVELPEGWLWVNENSNDFLLFLPESWRLIDPQSERGEARLKTSIASRPEWQQAVQPLGELDEALTYVFLAQGQVPPERATGAEAVVVVAQSRLLNQLAPTEMVTLAEELAQKSAQKSAQESRITLLESDLVAAVPGVEAEHVSLIVETEPGSGGKPVRCRQQLIPGRLYTLLVSGCTGVEPQYQTVVGRIMDSFQRLAP